jgi:Tfp pilus assembly protein PilN
MKTTLNLAAPTSTRERYALVWAIPLAVIGLAALVLLTVSAVGNYKDFRRARAAVLEVQREEARVRAQEAALRKELERPQLREVYRHTRFINGVIGRRQFSILQLVDKVTKLLPGEVRLEGLGLRMEVKNHVLRLAVSANDEESLEKFLINLEDSPDFADVTIISQGLPEEDAEGGVPATISCSVRYVGGGSP